VDIVVGKIHPAKKGESNKNNVFSGGRKVRLKEKRKRKRDRRQSVRDGVFVSLSFKNDRRAIPDRRKSET
jgi:hypothetical protein